MSDVRGYYGDSYDRYVPMHDDKSKIVKMKETYWTTKQVRGKIFIQIYRKLFNKIKFLNVMQLKLITYLFFINLDDIQIIFMMKNSIISNIK